MAVIRIWSGRGGAGEIYPSQAPTALLRSETGIETYSIPFHCMIYLFIHLDHLWTSFSAWTWCEWVGRSKISVFRETDIPSLHLVRNNQSLSKPEDDFRVRSVPWCFQQIDWYALESQRRGDWSGRTSPQKAPHLSWISKAWKATNSVGEELKQRSLPLQRVTVEERLADARRSKRAVGSVGTEGGARVLGDKAKKAAVEAHAIRLQAKGLTFITIYSYVQCRKTCRSYNSQNKE